MDANDMYQRQREADYQACHLAEFGLRGNAQNRQNKDKGQNDLHDQGTHNTALKQAILAKAQLCSAQNAHENGGTGDSAQELGDNVTHKILNAHLAGNQHGNGYGWIDVAAGNIADGIGHGNNHQSESEGCHQVGGVGICAVTTDYGSCAAGKQNQNQGADKLGYILLHILHKRASSIFGNSAESRTSTKSSILSQQ